jgi:hypothetical protein
MALKRVHIGLTPKQLKTLEKLADRFGLDLTNTIRHCIARVAEQELVTKERHSRGDK